MPCYHRLMHAQLDSLPYISQNIYNGIIFPSLMKGWSNRGPAHMLRPYGQIRQEVDPGWRKIRSIRGAFSWYPELKYMYRDCLLFGLISQIWQSFFFINHLLRNLNFNRSARCPQVSRQCPLGLLFMLVFWLNYKKCFYSYTDMKHFEMHKRGIICYAFVQRSKCFISV